MGAPNSESLIVYAVVNVCRVAVAIYRFPAPLNSERFMEHQYISSDVGHMDV